MDSEPANGATSSEPKGSPSVPSPPAQLQTIEPFKSSLGSADIDTGLPPRLQAVEAALQLYPTRLSLWLLLLERAQLEKTIASSYVRSVFDRALALFPSSLRLWRLYIRYEAELRASASLEPIYGRALKSGGLVYYELWMDYISYCRTKYLSDQNVEPETHAANVSRLIKVFEGASVSCGADPCSGDFWRAYVAFLESAPISGSTGVTSYVEQSRMDAIRKTYQRLIALPHASLESLWRSYDAFENGLNKSTAKKILSEKSSSYMTARASWKEITELAGFLTIHRTDWIDELPRCAARRSHQKKYYASWKSLLDWEAKNMLHLEEPILNIRLKFVFQLSLANCPFYEELWARYANWTRKKEPQEYAAVLKSGLERLPYSTSLAFQLAEHFEESRELESAKNVYEVLASKQQAHYENLIATIERLEKKQERDREREREQKERAHKEVEEGDSAASNEDGERPEAVDQEFLYSLQDYKAEVTALNESQSLVYIQYMHFCRRTDGLVAARTIFSRARKLAGLSGAAFIAAAKMEYFASDLASSLSSSAVHPAFKIFELGYKRFSREPIFLVEYMKLLLMARDSSNARSLLERSISMTPPIPLLNLNELWDLLMDYEKENGALSSLQSLSERKEKYLNETQPEIQGLIERTRYLTLSISAGYLLEKSKAEPNLNDACQKKPGLVTLKKKKSSNAESKIKKSRDSARASEPNLDLDDWLGSLKRLVGPMEDYAGPVLSVEALIARLLDSSSLIQARLEKSQPLRARMAANLSPPKAPIPSGLSKRKKIK